MEFKFVCIQDLTENLFKAHPVWILYEDPEQDDEISSWGVNLEKAWEEKTENPENEYYFPYLGTQEPGLARGTKVYCSVKTNSGKELSGVLIGGFAFSVFVAGKQFIFNRNMPDFGAKSSEELCSAIGANEENVFPLTFIPTATCFLGKSANHDRYW